MKLAEISVKRPITTMMVFVAIVLFGIIAIFSLPKDLFPEIEIPTLTIITVYPGASADEVEQQITNPLETVLSGAMDVKKITSKSKENVSFISLQYNWGADISEAANNARDLMELAKGDLPAEAESPFIMKINSSMYPVVIYSVNANESYNALNKIIDDKIITPLKKIPGLGSIMQIGTQEREIKILVKAEKLQAYHLSIQQLSTVLQMENIDIPAGNIDVGTNDFSVKIPGKIQNMDELAAIPISYWDGKLIKLGDIAEIEDGFKEKSELTISNKQKGVALFVQKQSGTNSLEMYEIISKAVQKIQKTLPPDVRINEIINTSEIISEVTNELSRTIWWAILFVIIVVFAFLRSWRNSLIIISSIPVALIVGFISMYLLDYTINIFSLIALVVASGMVVDNATVVLENINRHIEEGSRPKQAAVFASGEMAKAISASTLTTICVFLPLLFMGGIVGIVFSQLAIITSITLLASLLVSTSLTPLMASQLLSAAKDKKKSRFYQSSEKIFNKVEESYKKALVFVLKKIWYVFAFGILLFLFSLWTAKNIGSDYIPDIDAGDITITVETQTGSSVSETEKLAREIEEHILENIPELRSEYILAGQTDKGLMASIGFPEGKNIATIGIRLVLPQYRDRSAKEIAAELQDYLDEIPQIEKYQIAAGSIVQSSLLGNVKPIEISIRGNNLEKLNNTATEIAAALKQSTKLQNIETTVDKGKIDIMVDINKEKAAKLGLNTAIIAMQCRQSIYGLESGYFTEDGEKYSIRIRYDKSARDEIEDLRNISITTLSGEMIQLGAVAEFRQAYNPIEIMHESQIRTVKVLMENKDVSLGEAATEVKDILKTIAIDPEIDVEVGGMLSEQDESFGSLRIIFLIGLLLVYMVMASLFESFKEPFIILFSIPFAIIGVIWAFQITGVTLSIVSFVGVIMLLGIVVNNGIVLVDYTKLLRARGLAFYDAITEAGKSRLRPVMMTSFTTMLAMLPMSLSQGTGHELWSPFGITIIGGLLISMFVSLFFVPVMYVIINYKESKRIVK